MYHSNKNRKHLKRNIYKKGKCALAFRYRILWIAIKKKKKKGKKNLQGLLSLNRFVKDLSINDLYNDNKYFCSLLKLQKENFKFGYD